MLRLLSIGLVGTMAGCLAAVEPRVNDDDPGDQGSETPSPTPGGDVGQDASCLQQEGLPVDHPRRLNITELNTIASDVLGLNDAPFSAVGNDYHERVGVFLSMSERFLDGYLEAAESVAARFVAASNLAAPCSSGPPPPPPPATDECDTTAECRQLHGPTATDCVNSQSEESYCQCGSERCVSPEPPPNPANETVECARDVLRPIADRLLRRPATDAQMARYASFVETAQGLGLSFMDGLVAGLAALLMSPDFLVIGTDAQATPGPVVLTGYDRAERLALALWDSVPDEALLEAARTGALNTDEGLRAQVTRMLADPNKGARFLRGFIESHYDLPSAEAVPLGLEGFGSEAEQLAADMRREAELILESALERNTSIDRLVQSNTTFVNQRLAEFYGISGVTGDAFVEVSTEGTPRIGGLLTTGAVLAQEGDLIHRGVNVLQGYLCQYLAPPDPGLIEEALTRLPQDATVREQIEFRKDNGCAGCHQFIDPLGAAFEVFDEASQLRDQYPNGDSPVYNSTFLGQSVSAPTDVTKVVLEGQFRRCLTSRVLGWVSFRRLLVSNPKASCASDDVLSRVSSEAGLRDLVVEAFLSDTFKNRVIAQP